LRCLCAAASAGAKGNSAIRRVAIGITLIVRQLCCPLYVPAFAFRPQGHAWHGAWPHGHTLYSRFGRSG
jgi:hypothetical protein